MTITKQLLLLEDDINLSTVLADYLRSKGYVVDTAMDGKEGWDLLLQHSYDLLLTDIMMPRTNGWQLLKKLRDSNNQIPVIIISAKNSREDIIKGYELGCDDYVTKPFSMDILIMKIEAVLRRCQTYEKDTTTVYNLNGMQFDIVRQTLGD
jgi:DNA-binding response OmpR family regulator